MKNLESNLKNRIAELEKTESKLFGLYNRHANSISKLTILDDLKTTIVKIDELKNLIK